MRALNLKFYKVMETADLLVKASSGNPGKDYYAEDSLSQAGMPTSLAKLEDIHDLKEAEEILDEIQYNLDNRLEYIRHP